MSDLRVRQRGGSGQVIEVTPESAGWTYVGFGLWKLNAGDTAKGYEAERETCLVFVSGRGRVKAGTEDLGAIGERTSPFEGKPWSVYVPAGTGWSVTASESAEIAVCTSPGSGRLGARVIPPGELAQETRGEGSNTRHVTNILPEWEPAESLLVVEAEQDPAVAPSYAYAKKGYETLRRIVDKLSAGAAA